jgi:hypothetical protein
VKAHEYEGHFSCVEHKRVRCCPEVVGVADTRLLYAVAYMWKKKGSKTWERSIDYLHAHDAADARWWFFQSENPSVFRRVQLVGIAPVIGYFVDDAHGEALSA